ncbi:MAG: hypothetical protein HY825_16980 [Acidobacteria bacterium]|nr:hypothetical protein [Acidobacteriota bacterium]
MEHPIPLEELAPEIARVCGPAAPGPAKLMAARGMMPMARPGDLVTVLYMLAHDPVPALSTAAKDSLAGLPPDVARSALSGDLDPRVLDYTADLFQRRDELVQEILRNARVADETVARLASNVSESIVELIAGNEVRLLRCPQIIEALYLNRRARMSTVDRVIELAVRNGLTLEAIPAFREIVAAIEGQVILEGEPGGEATPDDTLFTSALGLGGSSFDLDDGGGLFGEGGGEFSDFDNPNAPAPKPAGETDEKRLGFDVSRMTVSQKIRLALLGNAGHRALLIRDPNKLVAMAAIKSPAVTDQEVGVISQSRSVSEDVIRFIADNREWTKTYLVKVNLVNNPKTPIAQSLRFLTHLRQGDLRALTSSKNVPQALTNGARQLLQRKPGGAK